MGLHSTWLKTVETVWERFGPCTSYTTTGFSDCPHSFHSHGTCSPSPPALSSPNVDETEWLKLPLAFMFAAMSQKTLLHGSLFLGAYVPGIKTLSQGFVSAVCFRPARKSNILSLCFPVQLCQYFYQCLCLELLLNSLVCDFQVHYEWWRKILKYFWMSVVVYTMLVLIFIYTYQFESFPGLWKNMTGLDESK